MSTTLGLKTLVFTLTAFCILPGSAFAEKKAADDSLHHKTFMLKREKRSIGPYQFVHDKNCRAVLELRFRTDAGDLWGPYKAVHVEIDIILENKETGEIEKRRCFTGATQHGKRAESVRLIIDPGTKITIEGFVTLDATDQDTGSLEVVLSKD